MQVIDETIVTIINHCEYITIESICFFIYNINLEFCVRTKIRSNNSTISSVWNHLHHINENFKDFMENSEVFYSNNAPSCHQQLQK